MCSLWGYCLTKSDLVCCLVILCVCVLSLRHSPMLARWKILFPWAVGVISTILGSQSPKGQRQLQCLSEDKYWSIFNPLGYLAAVYNKYRRFISMYQLFFYYFLTSYTKSWGEHFFAEDGWWQKLCVCETFHVVGSCSQSCLTHRPWLP